MYKFKNYLEENIFYILSCSIGAIGMLALFKIFNKNKSISSKPLSNKDDEISEIDMEKSKQIETLEEINSAFDAEIKASRLRIKELEFKLKSQGVTPVMETSKVSNYYASQFKIFLHETLVLNEESVVEIQSATEEIKEAAISFLSIINKP